jgi:hypothetical protein
MIFWCYTIAVLSALLLPFFPRAALLSEYTSSLTPALLYVVSCYVAFVAAYVLRRNLTSLPDPLLRRAAKASRLISSHTIQAHPDISSLYLAFLAIWAVIGVSVMILQVQMTLGLDVYLGLISQGAKAVESARGATILIDSAAGGLPGFIKVWNQNCTTSALLLILLFANGYKISGFWRIMLACVITGCYVLRNFISLDRLALLALIPAAYYLWQVSNWRVRKLVLLAGFAVFCLAQIQSMRRDTENGVLGFFILYVQSGMINLNSMIDSLRGGHTHGFASVLSGLFWVLKAMHINVISPDVEYNFVWNDAGNAYGYLFMDFGFWGPVLMLWAGAMAQRIDRLGLYRGLPSDWKVNARIRLRAFLAYAALSSMFVPAYLGPEFSITLFSLAAAAWLEGRFPEYCFKLEKAIAQTVSHPCGKVFLEKPRPAVA